MEKQNIKSIKIVNTDITKEINENKNNYAFSINLYRSFIDIRDGQKTVGRRCLYTMGKEMNATKFTKVAAITGNTLAKFHPHGEASVNDAIVKMGQWFYLNNPLVIKQGNFGSITGDNAAAPRYIECKLSGLVKEALDDLKFNCVKWNDNYLNTEKEPEVLPMHVPIAIINGGFGIGQGYKCQVPPHNFNEVCDIAIKILEGEKKIDLEYIANNLKPDFPTGGIIINESDLPNIYKTGSGGIVTRGEVIKDLEDNSLTVKSIPYMTSVKQFVDDLQTAIKNGKIKDITKIIDSTTGRKKSKKKKTDNNNIDIDIKIKVKKGIDINIIENLLYQNTCLQSLYQTSLVLTKGLEFRKFNIYEMFMEWINFRQETLKKALSNVITKKTRRQHILEGLILALTKIDDIIIITKKASDKEDLINKLMKKFKLSYLQADEIALLPLYRLTKLSLTNLKDEKKKIEEEINENISKLKSNKKLDKTIIEELKSAKIKYGKPRKTITTNIKTKINVEDLIENNEYNIFLTKDNFIKKIKKDSKTRGKIYGKLKETDSLISTLSCFNKDVLLFFSEKGKVFSLRAFEIKDHNKESLGEPILNYLNNTNDKIVSILNINKDTTSLESFLLFLTKNGDIKKTKVSQYQNINKSGIKAFNLKEDDILLSVQILESEDNEIVIGTKQGLAVRFKASEVPSRLRAAGGVLTVKLEKGNSVISANIIKTNNENLICFTNKGNAKKIKINTLPSTSRGTKGKMICKCKDKEEIVRIDLLNPKDEQEMTIITNKSAYKSHTEKIAEKIRTTVGKPIIKLKNKEEVIDILY